jgi:hypothetical protein
LREPIIRASPRGFGKTEARTLWLRGEDDARYPVK